MDRRAVAVAGLVLCANLVGCSAVSGTAQHVTHDVGVPERGYGYAADRCGLLQDISIQQLVGADQLVRPYSGAVCQYVLTRGSTFIDVTYSWFKTGSLDRERGLAQSKKAQISDLVLDRHQAFLARRSVTGNACAATAATNPGVASWWVQIRGDSLSDPCQVAQTLLDKTLLSDT